MCSEMKNEALHQLASSLKHIQIEQIYASIENVSQLIITAKKRPLCEPSEKHCHVLNHTTYKCKGQLILKSDY